MDDGTWKGDAPEPVTDEQWRRAKGDAAALTVEEGAAFSFKDRLAKGIAGLGKYNIPEHELIAWTEK